MKKLLKTPRFLLGGSIVIVLVLALVGYIGIQATAEGTSPFILENHFIESMRQQNYEAAFSNIDAQQCTINGQHLNQTQFIQAAQAADAREGRITGIGGDRASADSGNNERTITWTFSRTQASYPVHVTMKIINENFVTQMFGNYQYKITSISRL